MFALGLIFGVLLAVIVVGGLVLRAGRSAPISSYDARQTIWDIERRTIHNLLTAEFMAYHENRESLSDILQDK